MRTLTTLIAIGAILLVTACKKTNSAPTPTSTIITKNDFPLKMGNWWRYLYRNAYSGRIDTFTVTVTGYAAQPGLEVWTCIQKENNFLDTCYFDVTDTSIVLRNGFPLMSFATPLPVDTSDKKIVNLDFLPFSVVSSAIGQLGGQSYQEYETYGYGYALVYYADIHAYIAKGIGVVSQKYFFGSGPNSPNGPDTVYLIDYHLNR